jgi:hypothetical protein
VNFALIKAAAALLLTVTWSGPVRRRLEAILIGRSRVAVVALFGLYRLAICLLAFVILGLKIPGDPVGPYATFARSILRPTAVHASPYSPGFDFLLAGLWWGFGSSLSFVFAMTLFELAAFALFWSATGERKDEAAVLSLAVLWLVNPLSLFFVTLGGQDEALVLLVWCAVAWAVLRDRVALGGIFTGFGLAITKILTVFAGLPLLVRPSRKTAIAAGLCVLVVAILTAGSEWLRVPVMGFLYESRLVTPGNIWALPGILWGTGELTSQPWQLGVSAVAIAGSIALVNARPIEDDWQQMLRITGVVGSVFLFVTPKAWTQYAVMFLPGILFLILSMPRRPRGWMVYVFLPVCSIEPSVWFHLLEGGVLSASGWARLIMFVSDLVVLFGYLALIWYGVRLRSDPRLVSTNQARRGSIAIRAEPHPA